MRLVTPCILTIVLAAPIWSQTTSTEILGLVTDPSGAAVAGARVVATRTATGEVRAAITDQSGEYSFPLLEIGDYSVRVEMPGFKSQTVPNLVLQLHQKARVNFKLELGDVAETVEVSASAAALKTEDATVGQVIENRRVIELPLNGRNISNLAVLVPGVQFGLRTGLADGQGGFPIPGAGVSIIANGIREIYGTVALDGVDAKNPRVHTTVFTPSIEAIEEFKVQTGSYSAEYGQGGGGIIQVSMKSGTNQLRGTAFEFLRNDRLDAEHYFLNFERPAGAPRLEKDRLRRNQFGAVVSGPVVLPGYNGRNRTFWAFDYEGRRETAERVQTAFFPPAAFRDGDFSALLTPAINTATGRPYRAPIIIFDANTGEPFAGNIIPRTRLHPGAVSVVRQFLPPAQFGQADILDFTARAAVPDIIRQNQYFWRVDHLFREKDRLFVRYAGDRSRRDQDYINPNFPTYFTSSATNLASQWIHTFNQNRLNEFRFGFNIADDDIGNPRTNTDFDVDALGIGNYRALSDGNRKLGPREAGVPLIGFTMGDRDTGNGSDRMDTLQIADNLSIHHDRHNFKMGVEYRYIEMNRLSANEPRGSLAFGANESGYNFASFLLGYPSSTRSAEALHPTLPSANRWGAYILDDWKATPRLTLNFGLRWDYFGVPVDAGGYWRSLSFERSYTAAGGAVLPTVIPEKVDASGAIPLWRQENRFFMPRVGLAFRPAAKWVVRAGAGWFANVEHLNTFTILANMPPLGGSQQFSSVTDPAATLTVPANGADYRITTRRFRPGSPIITLNDPFGGAVTVRPVNVLHIQPDHRSSDHWQWSFDIQRQLPLDTVVTLGYVGSKSTHVGNSIDNWNSPDPSPDTNFQRRREFQRFYDEGRVQDLGDIRFIDSYGNAWYHGLQLSAEKRYSHGLVYGVSYTFSKALGEGESGGNEGAAFQNPRDRLGSKARFSFDQTHAAVAHFVYQLPFGRGLRGLPAGILKDWQVNGILTLRSGFPFTVTGGDLNTGSSGIRPDRVADGRLPDGERSRARWYDTSAFRRVSCNIPSRPDLCHYGSAGKAILETPAQRNLDFSLYKNFPIRESVRLQFRFEAFNATNTPFFGDPNGISFQTIDSIAPDGPRDGEVRSLRTPMRVLQFGLKLHF
jgi:hypothetical protein